jgi:integrase
MAPDLLGTALDFSRVGRPTQDPVADGEVIQPDGHVGVVGSVGDLGDGQSPLLQHEGLCIVSLRGEEHADLTLHVGQDWINRLAPVTRAAAKETARRRQARRAVSAHPAWDARSIGLIWEAIFEDTEEVDLAWRLQRGGGHPLTHKPQLRADGSTDTLPLPPICLTALKIARQQQDQARRDDWPDRCICGERHSLVLTTRNGRPIEPRNINRAFDIRCERAGVRRITVHDTRRTCGSLLAAPDVHPRVAMQILRHSRIALTMEIYTQVPDEVTRARSSAE